MRVTDLMAAAGLLLVSGGWLAYLARIPAGRVSRRPVRFMLAVGAGCALALAAVAWSARAGSLGPLVVATAAPALVMGSLFFWLLTQRKTPLGNLKVALGDALLPFTATTSEGLAFDTADLAGERTLLKFFRGGW